MARNWGELTRDHVCEALGRYNRNPGAYTKAKHTFLIHDGKSYPAKAIRGIAYEVCFGEKISQDAFTGGKESARFFTRLGFEVETGGISEMHAEVRPSPRRGANLDRAGQKNALEAILQKCFGIVIAEKTFDWLRVPAVDAFDDTYRRIHEALCTYRGNSGFAKSGQRLRTDFYVESLDLIIEYDENQHFSHARHTALRNYPPDLALGFSVRDWMEACEQINATDNEPADRDEARAFYDAVRDIEIARHGMRLLRIRHGFFDWESDEAERKLLAMLKPLMPAQALTGPTVEGDPLEWRKLEVEFQRIRLNYMKWFFHFTPPDDDSTGRCGPGDQFQLFNAHNGTGFTVFPCGIGSVYVGGGQGCVALPESCFAPISPLVEETTYLKDSLSRRTTQAKQEMIGALRVCDMDAAWRMILEYWWLKLGLHEFAYDVTYEIDRSEPLPTDIRDFVFRAMGRGLTTAALDTTQFAVADVEHFVRHRMTWNRFACCSFDCGPIAVGRGGYISYEDMAAARGEFFAGRDISSASEDDKRILAKQALGGCCDFLALYYEKPLSSMFRYGGFQQNSEALAALIADTQNVLNGIIESEGLDMPTFTYVPK